MVCSEVLRFSHGIANLCDVFIGILSLVRADVVDVERGTVKGIAVVGDPCGNLGVSVKKLISCKIGAIRIQKLLKVDVENAP